MNENYTKTDLPVSVQESLVEAWVGGGLLQLGALSCSSACMGPFEGGRHYLHYFHHSLSEVAQSCPTLCNPMDCSLPGSSVHGIFQARVLEWAAISLARGSSQPRNWTQVSCIAGSCFTVSEKAMAPHSRTLAWKIPWMEEPGGLQFMGSRRVGHDWATSLSLFTFLHWRRNRQPTPVFLPGESQGCWSLVGCRLWGRTELDTTEAT